MRFCRALVSVVLFSSLAVAWQKKEVPPLPATPKQPVVDEYHSVKVTDNYRWLEDAKSPQVVAWTDAQDKHARAILDPLALHAAIHQFIKKLDSEHSPSYYNLETQGGVVFAMNSQPGKQQDLLVTLRSADDPASKHYVDPRAWFYFDLRTKKTTVTALRETSPVSFADVETVLFDSVPALIWTETNTGVQKWV